MAVRMGPAFVVNKILSNQTRFSKVAKAHGVWFWIWVKLNCLLFEGIVIYFNSSVQLRKIYPDVFRMLRCTHSQPDGYLPFLTRQRRASDLEACAFLPRVSTVAGRSSVSVTGVGVDFMGIIPLDSLTSYFVHSDHFHFLNTLFKHGYVPF